MSRSVGSILSFFADRASVAEFHCDALANRTGIRQELEALDDEQTRTMALQFANEYKGYVQFVIGGATFGEDGSYVSATAIAAYFQNADAQWHKAVLGNGSVNGYTVHARYSGSIGDELNAAIGGDYATNAIAYAIMFVWVAITIGGVHPTQGMPLVGLAAVLTVLLSTAAGFGLCLGFGVEFTTITPVLPFVLLGIGVDDAYVLTSAYGDQDPSKAIPERISLTLRQAGAAVTMTSLTDIAAFAVGTLSSLPAVQSFCTYAAVCIAADFVMQITFFLAFVALDRRRAERGHYWFACCKQPKEVPLPKAKGAVSDPWHQQWLRNNFAPFLMKPAVRATVLVVYTGLLGLFVWGIFSVKVAQTQRDLSPRGSYLPQSIEADERLFREGTPGNAFYVGAPRAESQHPHALQPLSS